MKKLTNEQIAEITLLRSQGCKDDFIAKQVGISFNGLRYHINKGLKNGTIQRRKTKKQCQPTPTLGG